MANPRNNKIGRNVKIIFAFLILVILALLIGLIVVTTRDDGQPDGHTVDSENHCKEESMRSVHVEETDNPGVFQDLTMKEITGLKKYLYEDSGLNLVKPSASKTNASYVFLAELHIPNKSEVLNYLDHNGPRPNREARVIIIRGRQPGVQINELVVGPLPDAVYHKPMPGINASLPYFYRPMTDEDYGTVISHITSLTDEYFGDIILKCFGAKLKDCGSECLAFLYASSFSPASSGAKERKTWYWLTYDVEYYTLHPVDFSVLANIKPDGVHIDIVWFLGKQFSSFAEAKTAFSNHSISCQPRSFPQNNKQLFSTMNKRGTSPPLSNRRPPIFFEPDGRRYTINGNMVNYMKWSFYFRLSTAYGPQLYDVKFDGERIAYEIGLQEISVFYSGNSPHQRFSDYMDSAELIGPSAQGLIPGVDCPSHATFVDTSHITESSETRDVIRNSICIFELNAGEPLRRHHSYFNSEGRFYEGMENVLLVLRTVVTVVNYDYILEFRFVQNGVLEVRGLSTGYVLANAFADLEKKYGFQIHDKITANYHNHLFNFKVDLDINGVSNSYQMLRIEPETTKNTFSVTPGDTYSQAFIRPEIVQTEKQAAYKFDFDKPKYHIFYNNSTRNKYNNQRAYRLIHKGMVKQVLPEGHNKESSISWARYQFAVTRHKDHEAHSSSMYSMFDTLDKVVDFEKYIADNESIVDKDLVIWLTLGLHHIPHTEDLPVTATSGMGLSFVLQPYNYFTEDPSMATPNAVRIEPGDDDGIRFQRYETPTDSRQQCVPPKTDFEELVKKDNTLIFEQE